MWRISLVAVNLTASQEGLCSMELVIQFGLEACINVIRPYVLKSVNHIMLSSLEMHIQFEGWGFMIQNAAKVT
jgi:hypothetical protein